MGAVEKYNAISPPCELGTALQHPGELKIRNYSLNT